MALDGVALQSLREWKSQTIRTAPEDFIFGTRNGKPDRHRKPAVSSRPSGVRRAGDSTGELSDLPADIFNLVPLQWHSRQGHCGTDGARRRADSVHLCSMDEGRRAAAERISAQLVTIGHSFDEKSGHLN